MWMPTSGRFRRGKRALDPLQKIFSVSKNCVNFISIAEQHKQQIWVFEMTLFNTKSSLKILSICDL